MRVLFCNIAWMNYYKGIIPGVDEPYGGGSYVLENQDAHEKYNFDPLHIELEDGTERDACFGKRRKAGKGRIFILRK